MSKGIDSTNKSITRLAQRRYTDVTPAVALDFSRWLTAFPTFYPWL